MASLGNSTKHTKKNLKLILLKLFQKIEEEGIPPIFFHEVTITLIPKLEKDTTKNYKPISLKNTDENILNKMPAKQIQHIKNNTPQSS